MSCKSRVCVGQTINLAKKNAKISQVFQDNTTKINPNTCKRRIAPIQRVPAKTIRICTGAQLKKVCRRPCVCPTKKKAMSMKDLVALGFKSIIFGSLVYYTCQAGLWGDAEESELFFQSLCEIFGSKEEAEKTERVISEACEAEMAMIPSKGEQKEKCKCARPPIDNARLAYTLKEMWNHAVIGVFGCIAGFPANLSNLFPAADDNKCK